MMCESKNESVDIIMLALSRWDNPYSSTALSIAKEFAKKRRVFFVENPFTYKDLLFYWRDEQVKRRKWPLLFRQDHYQKIDGPNNNLIAITPPLVLPINFLPEGKLYDMLLKMNDMILFAAIKRMMRKFGINEFVYVNMFNPFYGIRFPNFFKPKVFVYYTLDDIAHSLYVKKHGVRLEREAMQRARFTLATSRELQANASRNTSKVYYLPNGFDHSIFLNLPDNTYPADLKRSETPIIAFIGNCDHRIDYDLLKLVLERHKDKTLVMVGPFAVGRKIIDELLSYPNLRCAGRKELSEIPWYLSVADCLIIPYKCNPLTKSIYPLKLNEYLASGTPVVCTPFSEDVMSFGDVVMISESDEDFSDKISLAISTDTLEKREARINAASQNRWQDRVDKFWSIVEEHLTTS